MTDVEHARSMSLWDVATETEIEVCRCGQPWPCSSYTRLHIGDRVYEKRLDALGTVERVWIDEYGDERAAVRWDEDRLSEETFGEWLRLARHIIPEGQS